MLMSKRCSPTGHSMTITAYELLVTAPDNQVKRAQIAHQAIAAGRWTDAAYTLRNAAREEANEIGTWADDALELAEYCERAAL